MSTIADATLGDLPEHVCGSTGFGLGADDECAACQWWRRKWDLENKTIPYADHLSAIAALQSQIAELEARQVPAGWVAVPREPTREMLMATAVDNDTATDYRAMIKAAPSPAATDPLPPAPAHRT